MIHYLCSPIYPRTLFDKVMPGRNALVSYYRNDQINLCEKVCNSILIDNGAYSYWNKGIIKNNWDNFYKWLETHPKRAGFFIPDNIEGDPRINDFFIKECPFKDGIPVFHSHDNLDKLEWIISDFKYMAISSSYEKGIPNIELLQKLHNMMKIICDKDGYPKVKVHYLGSFNQNILGRYPFYSCDSSEFNRDHFKVGVNELLYKIESVKSPSKYDFKSYNAVFRESFTKTIKDKSLKIKFK